jgi:hypothetical protein
MTTTLKTFDNLPQFGGHSFEKDSCGEYWYWNGPSCWIGYKRSGDGYGTVFTEDYDYFHGTEGQCYDWIVSNIDLI